MELQLPPTVAQVEVRCEVCRRRGAQHPTLVAGVDLGSDGATKVLRPVRAPVPSFRLHLTTSDAGPGQERTRWVEESGRAVELPCRGCHARSRHNRGRLVAAAAAALARGERTVYV